MKKVLVFTICVCINGRKYGFFLNPNEFADKALFLNKASAMVERLKCNSNCKGLRIFGKTIPEDYLGHKFIQSADGSFELCKIN